MKHIISLVASLIILPLAYAGETLETSDGSILLTHTAQKLYDDIGADGAIEFTVSESAYIHITYYYSPSRGLIRPVQAGGC